MKWPGFKILDRYITLKFLGTYVFAIALISVVIVIFDMAEKMDDFIELKAPMSEVIFGYYLNYIPFLVNQFSGLFTFIAVIFITSKMAANTEIVAILSGGVSFDRLLWPYFLSAAVIALLSLMLSLFVIPVSNQHRFAFESQYIKSSRMETGYERHIYRQVTPGTFAYIRNFNGRTQRADFLALETYEGAAMTASLEAPNVRFDSVRTRWTAPDYIERTFVGQTEHFEKKVNLDTLINLTTAELGKVEELVRTMNFVELNHFVRQQQAKGSDMVAVFQVEKYNRWAYPMASFILTLMGVALSSRKVRGGTGLHIGLGIGLCFAYILLMKFAEEFGKSGVVPPAIVVWMPNILFAAVAVYLYRRAPK